MTDLSHSDGLPTTVVGRDEIFLIFAGVECRRAIDALEKVEHLASVRQFDEERQLEIREWISVFDAIRMALHFTGSVSRVFFPVWRGGKFEDATKKAQARAQRLRQITGIAHDHPIKERALRDDVEHMDERLDAWIGGPRRPFGMVEAIIHQDLPQITRNSVEGSCPFLYYEATREVSVFGNRMSLGDWKNALIEVQGFISSGYETLLKEARAEGRDQLT